MPVPTREQLIRWADGYVELWNSGDKRAWEKNWRDVAPGEFRMVDPVGTPERLGFEACALAPYDLFQPVLRYHVPAETRFGQRIANPEDRIAESAFGIATELREAAAAYVIDDLETVARDEVSSLLAETKRVVKPLDRVVERPFAIVNVRHCEIGAPVLVHPTLDDQVGESDFCVHVVGVARQGKDGCCIFGAQRFAADIPRFEIVLDVPAHDERVLVRELYFERPGAFLRIGGVRGQHVEPQQPERREIARAEQAGVTPRLLDLHFIA